MSNFQMHGRAAAASVILSTFFCFSAFAGCNSGNTGASDLLASANCQASATGNVAVAVGGSANASGNSGVALGQGSEASGLQSTAVGTGAKARGQNSTVMGNSAGSLAILDGTISIGVQAGDSTLGPAGAYGISIGNLSLAGDHAVAIGGSSGSSEGRTLATGLRSIAIGFKSTTSADFGTNVGYNTTTGFASTAIGTDASATGKSASAFGRFANASAVNSMASGVGSQATGKNAVALGSQALASKTDSVALGAGSVADVSNVVSVGAPGDERRIVNVATATKSTDAVNLAQVKALIAARDRSAMAAQEKDSASAPATVARAISPTPNSKERTPSPAASRSSGCSEADIAGSWSVTGAQFDEIDNAMWCDVHFVKAGAKYDVGGSCRGHTTRHGAPQHYEVRGHQSIAADAACRFGGSFSVRRGKTEFVATILEGRIESAGDIKTRAVALSRWSHDGKAKLRNLVLQR